MFTRINRRLAVVGEGWVLSKRRGGGYVLIRGDEQRPVKLADAVREFGVERPYDHRKKDAEGRRQAAGVSGASLPEIPTRVQMDGFYPQDMIDYLRDGWLNRKIMSGQIDRAGRQLVEELIEDLDVYWRAELSEAPAPSDTRRAARVTWAIYSTPPGCPAGYLVVRWEVVLGQPTKSDEPIYAQTLEMAHANVPPGMVWRPADIDDPRRLVGCWRPPRPPGF